MKEEGYFLVTIAIRKLAARLLLVTNREEVLWQVQQYKKSVKQ